MALLLLLTTAVFWLASPAAAYDAAQPPIAESTSTPVSPSTSVPTPTTHSYEDEHSEQQPEGSSPALWILAGAVLGLVTIAVILLRAGGSPRHQVTRGT